MYDTKSVFIATAAVAACVLLLLCILCSAPVGVDGNNLYAIEQATETQLSQSYSPTIIYEYETKEYSIRQLRPEVFSVFAKEKSFIYDDYNYVEAIDNAIINISPKYKIESTTALTSYYSQGSEARHLLVMVSPRNASENI